MGSTPKSDLWGGVCGIPGGLLRGGGHELSLQVSSAGDSDREGSGWAEGGQSAEAPGGQEDCGGGASLQRRWRCTRAAKEKSLDQAWRFGSERHLEGASGLSGKGRVGWRDPPEAFPLHLKGARVPTETPILSGRLGGKACRPAPCGGRICPERLTLPGAPSAVSGGQKGPLAGLGLRLHTVIPGVISSAWHPGGRASIPIFLQKKLNCRLTDFPKTVGARTRPRDLLMPSADPSSPATICSSAHMPLRALYRLGPDIDFSLPPACLPCPHLPIAFLFSAFTSLHAICLVGCVPIHRV